MTTVKLFVERAKENAACRSTAGILFSRLYSGIKSLTALDPIPNTPEGCVIQDFGLGNVGEIISPEALEAWDTCVEVEGGVITVIDPTDGSVIYLGPAQYVHKVNFLEALGDERQKIGYQLDD